MQNFTEKFGAWLRQPFSPNMDAQGWFLFFGLLIVISFVWAVITRRLVAAGRAIT